MQKEGVIYTPQGVQIVGNVGQKLMSCGFDANALRPYIDSKGRPRVTRIINGEPVAVPTQNAVLRKDEWKMMDDVLLRVARQRLRAVADLQSRGLTVSIPNGLGTTVFEYEDVTELTAATRSMDGLTRGQNDRPNYSIKYLPMPITHKDFQINIRVLEASRTRGQALDTTTIELATRQVVELLESTLITGASGYAFGGGTIRGYTDFPNRVTGSLGTNWTASAATGSTILANVLAMKQALINVNMFGPYVLYIPTAYEKVLDDDFKANSDRSIRERILAISSIQDIVVLDKLTANNVLLVQMSSETVRLVEGLALTVVEWDSQGGMVTNYKVMAIQVPQIRADSSSQCGIAHYS